MPLFGSSSDKDNFKSWISNALLGVIALAPVGFYYYNKKVNVVTTTSTDVIQYGVSKTRKMEPGAEFNVVACKVIDGSVFRLLLDNNSWINARLVTATKEEATEPVSQCLKAASSPSVVLKRQIGDMWIVNLNITIDGRRTSLVEWLSERKLILN